MADSLVKTLTFPLLLSSACALAFAAFGMRPSGTAQLFMMVLVLISAGALLYYFFRTAFNWRTRLRSGLAALVLLLLAPVLGSALGASLRSAAFAHDLPRYNELATWATKQALPDREIRLVTPARYADLGSVIFVRESGQCGVTADILWGAAFPVSHWQRRYTSRPESQSLEACRDGARSSLKRAANWFEIKN